MNLRSIYYTASENALGGSDSEIPPFPVSVPSGNLEAVRQLRHGDSILITATILKPGPGIISGYIPDFARIYAEASSVKKLASD